MLVRLGPDWFVQNQMIRIKLRDKVTVDGLKTLANGKGVVSAYSLQLRGMTLSLRDAKGNPTWQAWREEPQTQMNQDVDVAGWNVVPRTRWRYHGGTDVLVWRNFADLLQ
ncbi:MAG: hypothetical protein ACR2HJ_09590 [Fimbriimonadales bacterium]